MPEFSQDQFETRFPANPPATVQQLRARANSSGNRLNVSLNNEYPSDFYVNQDQMPPFRSREMSDASMLESFVDYGHDSTYGYKRELSHR